MLYSANEVNELQLDADGQERVEFWTGVGARFGWNINNSRTKPIIDGTRRPRISDGIVDLIGSASDSRIGDLLHSPLSAVDHVPGLHCSLHSSRTPLCAMSARERPPCQLPSTARE